jgi:hypothetical protein
MAPKKSDLQSDTLVRIEIYHMNDKFFDRRLSRGDLLSVWSEALNGDKQAVDGLACIPIKGRLG